MAACYTEIKIVLDIFNRNNDAYFFFNFYWNTF